MAFTLGHPFCCQLHLPCEIGHASKVYGPAECRSRIGAENVIVGEREAALPGCRAMSPTRRTGTGWNNLKLRHREDVHPIERRARVAPFVRGARMRKGFRHSPRRRHPPYPAVYDQSRALRRRHRTVRPRIDLASQDGTFVRTAYGVQCLHMSIRLILAPRLSPQGQRDSRAARSKRRRFEDKLRHQALVVGVVLRFGALDVALQCVTVGPVSPGPILQELDAPGRSNASSTLSDVLDASHWCEASSTTKSKERSLTFSRATQSRPSRSL